MKWICDELPPINLWNFPNYQPKEQQPMSYTFTYVDKGVVNEYTVTDSGATWQDLLQHFEYFLKGCSFSFKDGFVGFDAVYQQENPPYQSAEDYDNMMKQGTPIAKSAAGKQMELEF